jgi:hypothetical protein
VSAGRESDPDRRHADEPPPILGSWRRLYALVLIALAGEIALFWTFTQAFR